jgi:hypothetical protein
MAHYGHTTDTLRTHWNRLGHSQDTLGDTNGTPRTHYGHTQDTLWHTSDTPRAVAYLYTNKLVHTYAIPATACSQPDNQAGQSKRRFQPPVEQVNLGCMP